MLKILLWIILQHFPGGTVVKNPPANAGDRGCISGLLCVLSHFSRVQLYDPMDCSLPGFSVHGILQTRILEWVAMPSCRGSFWPRDRTHIALVSCIAGSLYCWVGLKRSQMPKCQEAMKPMLHNYWGYVPQKKIFHVFKNKYINKL